MRARPLGWQPCCVSFLSTLDLGLDLSCPNSDSMQSQLLEDISQIGRKNLSGLLGPESPAPGGLRVAPPSLRNCQQWEVK